MHPSKQFWSPAAGRRQEQQATLMLTQPVGAVAGLGQPQPPSLQHQARFGVVVQMACCLSGAMWMVVGR